MRWVDIGHKELFAGGSGQVLSSTELRGLGLVLKYDRVGHASPFDEYIPSVAIDKLHCGILPGIFHPCFHDFQPDLRLIGMDSQPSLLFEHMSWITDEAYDLLRHSGADLWRRFPHAINDWISVSHKRLLFRSVSSHCLIDELRLLATTQLAISADCLAYRPKISPLNADVLAELVVIN